mmetsp:Transcript_5289/g.10914  ORF Transcript_5289/g.10914 Transcript_5289/m.10914 type:complete len:201 (-) Transcript_5289:1259-1861(-)
MDVEGVYSTNAISGPEWTARDYADNGFEYHCGTNNQAKNLYLHGNDGDCGRGNATKGPHPSCMARWTWKGLEDKAATRESSTPPIITTPRGSTDTNRGISLLYARRSNLSPYPIVCSFVWRDWRNEIPDEISYWKRHRVTLHTTRIWYTRRIYTGNWIRQHQVEFTQAMDPHSSNTRSRVSGLRIWSAIFGSHRGMPGQH